MKINKILKNLILTNLFLFLTLFIFVHTISAHPIDQTYTVFFTDENIAGELPPTVMTAQTRANWIQVGDIIGLDLLNANVDSQTSLQDLFISSLQQQEKEVFAYFRDTVAVTNNGLNCRLENMSIEQIEPESLLFSGVPINFDVTCDEDIDQVTVTLGIFLEKSPLQVNTIDIYRTPAQLYTGAILTPQKDTFEFSNREVFAVDKDTTTIPIEEPTTATRNNTDIDNKPTNTLIKKASELIEDASATSLFLVVLIAIVIGALHALEGGHSKTILASIMINDQISLKRGFIFVSIFTLTHMSDILLVGLALVFLDQNIGLYSYMSSIQLFSVYAMLLLSVVLLCKEASHLLRNRFKQGRSSLDHTHRHHDHGHDHHHHNHSHEHDHSHQLDHNKSTKEQMLIAFFEGLAPCLTGWTLMMLIIATRKLWLVLPVVAGFAVGIAIVLTIFVVLVYIFRQQITDRFSVISTYSGLISSLILLALSLSLIF